MLLAAALFAFTGLARADDAAAAATVTLRQCYDWALERSEDLKRRAEDVVQAEQLARGAFAGLTPRVDWQFTQVWQDPEGVRRLEAQGFSGFVQREQAESFFSLNQPVFSGFKEFSALKGFRKQSERDALRVLRAKRELFERAAAAYYAVLGRETEAANTGESLSLAQDRVKELGGLKRLGKARQSEQFTAQAHAAALRAELRRSQARIASAREELSFLTGRDLSKRVLVDELAGRLVPPLEAALSAARERSDVRAQRDDAAAADLRVRFERGSYWPSVDLAGRYYTRRATFMREIDWDAALSLRLPLFQGARVDAAVKRAQSAHRQSLLVLEELERLAAYQTRRLHGELASSLEAATAQEESAEAARRSYESQREEYTLGLVTNLDVLQALDLLQVQRGARDAARLEVRRLTIGLGVATETLP
ncbi:MAG: TolC family protein [Elusimicrobia bacterium]|nr:TolC family protein [Elusimicrobiota bacterium]